MSARKRKVWDHDDLVAAVDQIDPSLLGCRWSVEDREGCDTAWMLATVDDMSEALTLLREGHAPSCTTPYPETARWLLERRLATITRREAEAALRARREVRP